MSELQSRLFMALEKSLLASAQGLFSNHDSHRNKPIELCIALSGGLDSCVLLHLVHTWINEQSSMHSQAKYSVSAFHVNHGISPYAARWEQFCLQTCNGLNIPFASAQLFIKKRKQHSLEADARDARYECLDEHAKTHKIVLLAQHQDDQLETLLLQIKRGAGIDGLSSMQSATQRNSGTLYLRPLLDTTRSELKQYAEKLQIEWIEDESNQDLQFDRNFLRQEIIPRLLQRWPSLQKTASRTASLCTQASEVNREYMALLSKSLIDQNNNIIIGELQKLSLPVQQSYLKYWLYDLQNLYLSHSQQQDIFVLIASNKNNSGFLQYENRAIERFQGLLRVTKVCPNIDNKSVALDFSEKQSIQLSPQYSLQRLDSIIDEQIEKNILCIYQFPIKGVICQFGASHLKFKFRSNRPRKTLKAWFQEWAVSPLERQSYPIFSFQDIVLAVREKVSEEDAFKAQIPVIELALVQPTTSSS